MPRQNSGKVASDGMDVAKIGRQVANTQSGAAADNKLAWLQHHTLHLFARLQGVQARDCQYLI